MERIWILGAADPEMEAIEALLTECGETVVHATIDGKRVHPGNAYRADCPPPASTLYYVECSPQLDLAAVGADVHPIDHHRPHDLGFGRPPSEFFTASSIGQVVIELGELGVLPEAWITHMPYTQGPIVWGQSSGVLVNSHGSNWAIPIRYAYVAAADHCLGAAYRGECPGVDPDDLAQFRAEERARFQSRTESGVTADVILGRIAETQAALAAAPWVTLVPPDQGAAPSDAGHYALRDMRRTNQSQCANCTHVFDGGGPCPSCHWEDCLPLDSQPWPELPEAATRLGVGYISGPLESPDGRRKFTCSGSAEQVRAWLEHWAPGNGIVDTYDDPARGFAGGYAAS